MLFSDVWKNFSNFKNLTCFDRNYFVYGSITGLRIFLFVFLYLRQFLNCIGLRPFGDIESEKGPKFRNLWFEFLVQKGHLLVGIQCPN